MIYRTAGACFLVVTLLSVPCASAEPAPEAEVIRVDEATAAPSVGARTRRVLRDAVRRSLAEQHIRPSLRRYSVSPSLIQLRRYVDAGSQETKTVCIVNLALFDDQSTLLGSVRGRATVLGGTSTQALEAAAHSASERIPEAVVAAERVQSGLALATPRT